MENYERVLSLADELVTETVKLLGVFGGTGYDYMVQKCVEFALWLYEKIEADKKNEISVSFIGCCSYIKVTGKIRWMLSKIGSDECGEAIKKCNELDGFMKDIEPGLSFI